MKKFLISILLLFAMVLTIWVSYTENDTPILDNTQFSNNIERILFSGCRTGGINIYVSGQLSSGLLISGELSSIHSGSDILYYFSGEIKNNQIQFYYYVLGSDSYLYIDYMGKGLSEIMSDSLLLSYILRYHLHKWINLGNLFSGVHLNPRFFLETFRDYITYNNNNCSNKYCQIIVDMDGNDSTPKYLKNFFMSLNKQGSIFFDKYGDIYIKRSMVNEYDLSGILKPAFMEFSLKREGLRKDSMHMVQEYNENCDLVMQIDWGTGFIFGRSSRRGTFQSWKAIDKAKSFDISAILD